MQFIAYIHFLAAIIAAKWSMEIGFSQVRQMLWGFGGLICGPLALLFLYVRQVSEAPESARKWF
jgi:hypothetical protein